LDTLGNNSVIEVIINNPDTNESEQLNIRGCGLADRVNPLTTFRYDPKSKKELAINFQIWINNECEHPLFTNDFGRVKVSNKSITKISFEYDNYLIKNPKSNYFILVLNGYPIYFSPPKLKWTKWVLKRGKLSPIECDNRIENIELKR
jgi:hypothetical protein